MAYSADSFTAGEVPTTAKWNKLWGNDADFDTRITTNTPVAEVVAYAGSTAPTGFLLCDGSAVSRTTYAALFAIIGTVYGAGNGSTTFNLPNTKGKVIVAKDSVQTEFDVVGETGGAKTHTLTSAEMPVHSHGKASQFGNSGNSFADYAAWSRVGGSAAGGAGSTDNAGSGGAHNNLQPYIVMNHIIKY